MFRNTPLAGTQISTQYRVSSNQRKRHQMKKINRISDLFPPLKKKLFKESTPKKILSILLQGMDRWIFFLQKDEDEVPGVTWMRDRSIDKVKGTTRRRLLDTAQESSSRNYPSSGQEIPCQVNCLAGRDSFFSPVEGCGRFQKGNSNFNC